MKAEVKTPLQLVHPPANHGKGVLPSHGRFSVLL